ncbi:phosphonate transport system ATP-binding protein [Variovorax boronicumulans]|jgi:phosphonate transport system ATP-binding protein|uniref:phosphonate ABC transporter ATP-binding protein n=1 Tax=Variovorax boronicumulans TaxID=436515 RepID=UPI002789A159|nr:phosphonate ABC transporter ATP-binding protein [Variovorax boronicumulans]MDP9995340.1 phosphonate transport system ATP-binding protein [Variovorax boronicumulans]MDQ0006630.1 phosphonate transport system ATP-binding protein [Variovorax boronicumulans]
MIEIRGLCKRYGDFTALHRVDLTVGKGEFVVILGASGAGKSTLLRCINHLAEPSEGEIHVDGERSRGDRAGLRKVRRDVAMIFQHYNVVPRLSVLKNVLTGRLGSMPAIASWFQIFPAKDIAIARECLRRVELDHKSDLRTDTLSGGQKQRVGIARALAQQPKVILADEPVASLDPKTSRKVLNYLKQASSEAGITVICNLHQVDYAREFAQRVIGVAGGRVVFEGRPDELTEEVLQRIYPGGLEDGPIEPTAPAASPVAAPVAAVRPAQQLALEQS